MGSTLAPASTDIDLDTLAAALDGELLRPGDAGYETARRGHNLALDARPLAVVRAAGARDVAAAVDHARVGGFELAIRGGGHSPAGHSSGDGVLLVDLGAMTQLDIDPDSRVVRAEPGLTAGAVTAALAEHGLAIPFGDTPTVGIAGLTLGGGIGYLARKHGLAVDHLEAVEIVLADGRLVTASASEHPDLFWAVRGGGGNFGIVTRFVYRAVPVGMVYGGALVLPATAATIAGIAAAADAAPDELTTITDMMFAPPMPFLPEAWTGKPILIVTAVHAGDPADGPAALAPFRALAEPIADLLGEMPYPGIYGFTEEAGTPMPYHIRSSFLTQIDAALGETVMATFEAAPPGAMFQFRVLGGAMARVHRDATAFAHRHARFMVMALAVFGEGGIEAEARWVDAINDAVRPLATGAYSNFLAEEGRERITEAYPARTYERLVDVKRTYDPGNLFRRNQNIRPD